MIWTLLIAYQVKHWFADFPLQGTYMLGKFKRDGWVFPLAAHCLVHAGATAFIVACVGRFDLLWLAAFDLVIHFAMDRFKASPNMLGKFKALNAAEMQQAFLTLHNTMSETFVWKEAKRKIRGNTLFWWALGFDQAVHHLTHYFIIYKLVTG